jgi:hypothetical protein
MRVTVVRGGGLAGLVTRTELDDAALPPADAAALREHAQRAGLLGDAPATAAPTTHPDEMQYELRVEDAGKTRALRFSDTTLPDPARELLQWIDARPERSERVG